MPRSRAAASPRSRRCAARCARAGGRCLLAWMGGPMMMMQMMRLMVVLARPMLLPLPRPPPLRAEKPRRPSPSPCWPPCAPTWRTRTASPPTAWPSMRPPPTGARWRSGRRSLRAAARCRWPRCPPPRWPRRPLLPTMLPGGTWASPPLWPPGAPWTRPRWRRPRCLCAARTRRHRRPPRPKTEAVVATHLACRPRAARAPCGVGGAGAAGAAPGGVGAGAGANGAPRRPMKSSRARTR